MTSLLKDVYTKSYLADVAKEFKKHYSDFNSKKFLSLVLSPGWSDLELKMRMKRITLSLHETLPNDYFQAVDIITKAAAEFSGFEALFFPDYVETYGQDKSNFEYSLKALEELTKYSSSEFAIRPFILLNTTKVMKKMLLWSKSKNYHVRRLASEGCRSRLPWAISLRKFKEDPSLIIPILDNLKNDTELYVRKSVANNLNDISKDHPDIVIELSRKWYGECPNTDWVIKHGLRTLLKRGHPQALNIIGYSNSKNIKLSNLILTKKRIKIGADLEFNFLLNILRPSKVRVEYKIYYLKSNGDHNAKIFKVTEGDYNREEVQIRKKQSFREMTTRKHYRGEHFLAIVINGIEKDKVRFEVI